MYIVRVCKQEVVVESVRTTLVCRYDTACWSIL